MPDFGPPVRFLAELQGELTERETTTSAATSQDLRRALLLTVRARIENGLWERACDEQWLTPRVLAEFNAGKPVTHSGLEASMAAMERAEIVKYGSPLGVAMESDADGTDVRGVSGIPDLRVPVPIRALYTPSLVPGWSGTAPSPGKFLIGEGISFFTCPFMAVPGEAPDSAVVTLASPAGPCISAGFTYRLKLTGEFKIAFETGTRMPRTCEGKYNVVVDGGPTGQTAARLMDHKTTFKFHRVEIVESEEDIRLE